jgi:hypothetical protein
LSSIIKCNQWSNGETTEDIEITDQGTYTVTVTDALCGEAILDVLYDRPIDISLLSVIPSTTTTSNDGAIDISIPYLFPPYSFQWSNGEITEDISNLAPGSYSVTVTDGNCGIGTYNNIQIAACKGGLSYNFTIDETHTCIYRQSWFFVTFGESV